MAIANVAPIVFSANGVQEQTALQELKKKLSKMYGFTIEAFYRACDNNQSQNVRVGTFKHQMIKWKLGISDKNMNRIVAVLDEDRNRIISYDELQFALEAYQCAGEDIILDSSGLTYSFKAVFKLVKLI